MPTQSSLFFIGLGPAGKSLAAHIRQRPFFPVGKETFVILETTDAASLDSHLDSLPRPPELAVGAIGQNNATSTCIFLTVDLDSSTLPLLQSLSRRCLQEPSWFVFFILILPFCDAASDRQAAKAAAASLLQDHHHVIILDRDWLARRWPQQTAAELEKLATSWVIDNSRTNMATFLKKPGKMIEQKSLLLMQEPLEQLNLELPEMSAGIFTGDTPSLYRGQNYDFPTFQRLGIKPEN